MAAMLKWSLLVVVLLALSGSVRTQSNETTVADTGTTVGSGTGAPDNTTTKPDMIVTITAAENELETGDVIAITCARDTVADGDIKSVKFTKDGNEIATWAHHCEAHADYSDRDVECEQLGGENKHTLDLGDAIVDDTGSYECRIEDTTGKQFDSDNVAITVTAGGNGGSTSLWHNLWMLSSMGLVWLLRA